MGKGDDGRGDSDVTLGRPCPVQDGGIILEVGAHCSGGMLSRPWIEENASTTGFDVNKLVCGIWRNFASVAGNARNSRRKGQW